MAPLPAQMTTRASRGLGGGPHSSKGANREQEDRRQLCPRPAWATLTGHHVCSLPLKPKAQNKPTESICGLKFTLALEGRGVGVLKIITLILIKITKTDQQTPRNRNTLCV